MAKFGVRGRCWRGNDLRPSLRYSHRGRYRCFHNCIRETGIMGGYAAAALLVRLVGPRQARDLLLMPRQLTAAELLKRGLLTEIAAEGAFDEKANEIL